MVEADGTAADGPPCPLEGSLGVIQSRCDSAGSPLSTPRPR